MSVRVMTWAWEQDVPPNGKIVLLCLADHAHDDGRNAWPSVALIARKAGFSERQVQRVLQALVNTGVIYVQAPSTSRKPTTYGLSISEAFTVARDDFRTGSAGPELRAYLIERDAQACRHCGETGDEVLGPDGHPWEADRVQAGGAYTPENTVLSCRSCNRKRGGDRMTPHPGLRGGDMGDARGATSEVLGGDMGDARTITGTISEPSHVGGADVVPIDTDIVEARAIANYLSARLGDLDVPANRRVVTDTWVAEIRRMIQRDGRSPEQIRKAIDWAMADSFWRGTIQSPVSLRKHYDKMRLQAARAQHPSGRDSQQRAVADEAALTGRPVEEVRADRMKTITDAARIVQERRAR